MTTTTPSASAGLPLRQLRWPALPAVDLLEECRWLVTLDAANPARKLRDIEEQARHKLEPANEMHTKELSNLCKHKSPYRRPLRRSKPPAASPGSPAQQAAKSILKLKEGLLRLDGTRCAPDCRDDQAPGCLPPRELIHAQQDTRRAGDHMSPQPAESNMKSIRFGTARSTTSSPGRARSPPRSPSRKKKKRPPTREERQLAEKQERLAAWLKANPDAQPANVVQGPGRTIKEPATTAAAYPAEVQARIESAMQCRGPLESGVRLWDDPVRSLLAAEMTSESVFGGAVPTRALAFEPPQPDPPSRPANIVQDSPPKQAASDAVAPPVAIDLNEPTEQESEAHGDVGMSDHAQKVFDTAHRQVADGAVADALATLEAGIRQSLSTSQAHLDAVSSSHGAGFNYSVLAHKSAVKLQLHYRARHRRRVNRLVFLQRQWRWWHARQRALKALHFANRQAMVIQHRYRPWHTHITQVRSAVRIQRCFRVFESQKHVIRFRQICRLLLARRARCRQLNSRMRMIGRIVFLMRKRRRRIALIQGLWRRRCARAELAMRLAQVSVAEVARRAREDEFVAAKLARVRVHLREFLTNTTPGRRLVRWQQEKPWLRFRRLRHDTRKWEELPLAEKLEAVTGILPERTFRGLHFRGLCQMFVGTNSHLRPLPKLLTVSKESLRFLADHSGVSDAPEFAGCCACCPWVAGVREKMKRARAKLSRRAAAMWWSFVTYPKEYCAARVWPLRRRRQDQARRRIEDDCARVLDAFCRVWFRRIDSERNTPPYACEWCSEAFATSREFILHGKCAAARALAEAEWAALSQDLQFVRRKWWRLAKPSLDSPVRRDIYALDLDATSVQRLRRSRSRRQALMPLVAALEACTASDSPNAVIPLDLAGFLLRFLDDSEDSHPLMQTAEHQLVPWGSLVGSMRIESSTPTPEGSGRDSRWIRRDELRARLLVGSKWKGVLSRWRRSFGRRAPTYRALPARSAVALRLKAAGPVAAKWKELQLRMRRMAPSRKTRRGSRAPLSPTAAGTRVLPVAT